ncbi:MAG TPA: universal stress protein [Gammaproteobacteria bacterium]|nr:universal stress protein [Gammaproteobacteria bacterium]
MQQFKRILFFANPDAETETALERAAALAERNGAQLTLMDVLDPVPGVMGDLIDGWSAERLSEAICDSRRVELDALAAPARERGVRTEVRVVLGKPFLEVTREVLRGGHDLLIKGAPAGRAAGLVSTDMHLMRKCPVPIWVIKGGYGAGPMRILAAVDPDPEEPENDALNGRILQLAGSLAAWEQAELHVVHAWQVVGESMLRSGRGLLTAKEVDALERGIEDSHRQRLKALLDAHGRDDVRTVPHIRKGEPSDVILDTADAQRAHLIVMGTVARTGLAGFFIGNTAEEVLKESRASLLTVKPEGFRCPVALED